MWSARFSVCCCLGVPGLLCTFPDHSCRTGGGFFLVSVTMMSSTKPLRLRHMGLP
uniref:Uncharacterized protein n=1 Tax=Lepeophtheirus salmonis TaxID=72036 RepID=A0A0K2V1A3_LEPSM